MPWSLNPVESNTLLMSDTNCALLGVLCELRWRSAAVRKSKRGEVIGCGSSVKRFQRVSTAQEEVPDLYTLTVNPGSRKRLFLLSLQWKSKKVGE